MYQHSSAVIQTFSRELMPGRGMFPAIRQTWLRITEEY
jgi:hypothetical protein